MSDEIENVRGSARTLWDAIFDDDLDKVEREVALGANADAVINNVSPLLLAVVNINYDGAERKNKLPICRTLLKHGANPNLQTLNGFTILQYALIYLNHSSEQTAQLIMSLIDAGANINVRTPFNFKLSSTLVIIEETRQAYFRQSEGYPIAYKRAAGDRGGEREECYREMSIMQLTLLKSSPEVALKLIQIGGRKILSDTFEDILNPHRLMIARSANIRKPMVEFLLEQGLDFSEVTFLNMLGNLYDINKLKFDEDTDTVDLLRGFNANCYFFGREREFPIPSLQSLTARFVNRNRQNPNLRTTQISQALAARFGLFEYAPRDPAAGATASTADTSSDLDTQKSSSSRCSGKR